jgi:hypothetical protein
MDKDILLDQKLNVNVPGSGKVNTVIFQNQALTLLNTRVVAALETLDDLERLIADRIDPVLLEAPGVGQLEAPEIVPDREDREVDWKSFLELVCGVFAKRQYTLKEAETKFRKLFLKAVAEECTTVTEFCEKLGVSRSQGHKFTREFRIGIAK